MCTSNYENQCKDVRLLQKTTIPATHHVMNIFHILCVFSNDAQKLTVVSGDPTEITLTLKNLNENNII